MPFSNPIDYYHDRLRAGEQLTRDLSAKANLVSILRKLMFAGWVTLFLMGVLGLVPAWVGWAIGSTTFLGFLGLLAWHEVLQARMRRAEERTSMARTQLARLQRAWREVPEQPIEIPTTAASLSDDLDLFGHASVFQLLCRAHSPAGRALLRDWLLVAPERTTLQARHDSVVCLAPLREFREELDLQGRLLASSPAGPGHFTGWAEGPLWMQDRPWLTFVSRGLVLGLVVTIGLVLLGSITEPVAVGLCIALLAVNLLISVLLVGTVHDIFEKVDSRHRDIAHYLTLFEMFDRLPAETPLLAALQARMSRGDKASVRAMKRLSTIMKLAQMRHSHVLGIVHLGLQLVLLIDFHVLVALETWQSRYGHEVRGWFDALAELEALASLASLHHDHPDWVFPSVAPAAAAYVAAQLGHPLLAAPVRNDVTLGPPGRFLLVSGSNMSGKSTLLRAIGLNAILAQAGAPVCARSLSLPPVEIATSMRIHDSLEDGVSFFMAELHRLKSIVDQAERLRSQPDRTLLFLLDEILQGTNSAERHIAVARVVHRLTHGGAMGAITTHDLALANSVELAKICDPVYFQESFTSSGQMTFDYVMRQGVAKTTNALKLLELVGIE